jgi:hypothetical protein
VCMKSGGVTCLSSEGCRPEHLRHCVNLETLKCRTREGDSGDGDSVDTDNDDEEYDGMQKHMHYIRLLQPFKMTT